MDKKYMERALQLAEKGWGKTRPNPLVGAVVVRDDKILAEGYHRYYGGNHAEVDALEQINYDAKGATIYVTLEPCSHYGKTPPCVEAIIKSKIEKVVVALEDPNPLVAGRGISILREHGIQVVTGVMEKEAKLLNEIFIKYITTNRPFCILKTAMTLDGKIATKQKNSKWITGEASRAYVHHIRNRVSGIMVGVTTVNEDNPKLNTRIPGVEVNHPTRIIVDDKALRISLDSYVVQTAKEQKTIVVTTEQASKTKVDALINYGVDVVLTKEKYGLVDLNDLMTILGEKKIDSILLEGGGTLNYSALESNVVDKVISFIAPKIVGGREAITPVEGDGLSKVDEAFLIEDVSLQTIEKDILIEGYVRKEDNKCLQE
ncbi:bifunctional diaminohydroxyphosphoribosylaminopyrimidine deaminase/5-amino-6-(5-phosphoribosylamino)uracil reductase RibD [Serpentinicella sp. ANB-PHB4]|uniref:bifunctional diaminohydroxyphosphoribosylaminopyrimidine deaminase/5-amino-6-(5-phosphoribosylamino)uracil reductase RibD n=1 Tax=Serpentinicella sp. ANB-PHB4 TaxID=3074076 RepID=UPI002867517D|nr:bifunctional diaminohydroxyphosphoribosylaminopyrimidine deaminase/5-amino-6-(5-phosphoribosylamino)uracil reductase RibD [Serpentinicella sp. ANB-PHB4]MDR5659464.1 bifunctional diaminohydroxyphosphoribosylaminopyrimidine deaminase/5-amino-6-(5-phosphoribosylamino)uracil reductase RibD [Serpentinicella sp. ANB-PHB4]